MKIAALSDIHGNLAALDAVLDDVHEHNVDLIVNLGEMLSDALYLSQTADRLMPLGLPTIKGNHERQLLGGDPTRMGLSDRFAHSTLREDQLEWIRSLPTALRIVDDVLLVHGTPEGDLLYFLETVTEHGCRPATSNEVEGRARNANATLILCGHTHIRLMRLDHGCLIVNPGSVGLQAYEDSLPFPHRIEMGSPHARYALVTKTSADWEVEFRAVEYDWHEAANVAVRNLRPDWDNALRTGYC